MASLRNVRQQDAVRAFQRLGGVERPGKGSHVVVKMPNGRILSVPSGTLKIGLLRALLRAAELTEEEFTSAL